MRTQLLIDKLRLLGLGVGLAALTGLAFLVVSAYVPGRPSGAGGWIRWAVALPLLGTGWFLLQFGVEFGFDALTHRDALGQSQHDRMRYRLGQAGLILGGLVLGGAGIAIALWLVW